MLHVQRRTGGVEGGGGECRAFEAATAPRTGLYLSLDAPVPDMQLWFNLIFASDTDRVLAGELARSQPNQSWPWGSTEVTSRPAEGPRDAWWRGAVTHGGSTRR